MTHPAKSAGTLLCGPFAAHKDFGGAVAYIGADSEQFKLGKAHLAQRFHLDLTDGQTTIRDEDGVLARNLNEAIRQAEEVLAKMHLGKELANIDPAWKLVIRDAAGNDVASLPVVPHDMTVALAS